MDGFSRPHFEPLDSQAKVGFLAGMRLNSRKSRGIRSRHSGIRLAGMKEPAISGGNYLVEGTAAYQTGYKLSLLNRRHKHSKKNFLFYRYMTGRI